MTMTDNEVEWIFKVLGVGEEMEVFDDKLTITPKGVLRFMSKILKGTKTIPFSSIIRIQYKKPGLTSGYLQFTIPGNESKGGVLSAASDGSTFTFLAKVDDTMVLVKDFIERSLEESRQPAPVQTASAANEIGKLGELKGQGWLSEKEFSNA